MEEKLMQGIIKVHDKGFGFIDFDEDTSFFIPDRDMGKALNGDLVEFVKTRNKTERQSANGKIKRVVERKLKMIVGTVVINKGTAIIKADSKKIKKPLKIIGGITVKNGFKVQLEIEDVTRNNIVCRVVKVIGHKNDPGADILSIVYSLNIPTEFEQATIDAAEKISDTVSEADKVGRTDLRDKVIVTIDGESAKDLDDAVTVEKLANGNYMLGVYIADVSHYIKEFDAIDNEAFERSTSVYLADRVIPMLPRNLSNGICSLNGGVDRLVLGCEMEIDQNAKVVSNRIVNGLINTKHRMTYTDVNKMIDGEEATINKFADIKDMIETAYELSQVIRKDKHKRGSIDFDLDEPKIIVDDTGKAVDIEKRVRGEAEKLIEDFMVIANETVAKKIVKDKLPGIYRVHDTPAEKKLIEFYRFIKSIGKKVPIKLEDVRSKDIQEILDSLKGEEIFPIAANQILRSMAKAEYSPENIGHFGLASTYYTHFTSPIRRYPDLIIHRLLKTYYIDFDTSPKTKSHWQQRMSSIASQTSLMERRAIECERAVNDMKMAEYAQDHIGEEYMGKITSIQGFGMFVQLESTLEGLIHMTELYDDQYMYVEGNQTLVGKTKGRVFKLGDMIKIYIKAASKADAKIDFSLVEFKGMKPAARKADEGFRSRNKWKTRTRKKPTAVDKKKKPNWKR